MTIVREEVLRELGLTPRWRLRSSAGQGVAESPPLVEEPSPATPRSDGRGKHIATLAWPELVAEMTACTACGLCRTRSKVVPGVGDSEAEWMFVGEAPGADEDRQGEPFVGQAGRLLDSMLAAIGLKRGRTPEGGVYIANVLKCRPPGNRNPEPIEVAQCTPFLERQIDLIKPRLLIALGKFAAMTLLDTDASIAQLRGRVHRYRDLPLIVTYHPAYLLRNLPDKAKAWEDLCLARDTMRRLQSGETSPM